MFRRRCINGVNDCFCFLFQIFRLLQNHFYFQGNYYWSFFLQCIDNMSTAACDIKLFTEFQGAWQFSNSTKHTFLPSLSSNTVLQSMLMVVLDQPSIFCIGATGSCVSTSLKRLSLVFELSLCKIIVYTANVLYYV